VTDNSEIPETTPRPRVRRARRFERRDTDLVPRVRLHEFLGVANPVLELAHVL
jgi:hypothetical protein